jgi:hypothetical protein
MFERNKNSIVDTIKTLIYTENKKLFDFINFEDDFIYLEPMLFAYFNSNSNTRQKLPLEQLLYNYMTYETQNKGVRVKSDIEGNIYIPNLGYFRTKTQNKELIIKKNDTKYTLEVENIKIKFSFAPCLVVSKFNIEVVGMNNVLLEKSFSDTVINIKIEQTVVKHIQNLYKALNFIETECLEVANNISKSLRKIILFNSNELNSFASFSFQGIAFLNANSLEYDEVFFIDDISHQSGHIYFNIETYDKESYFNINPSITVSSLHKNLKNDERSIYVVFHAMFTYTQILKSLDIYYSKKYGNQKQLKEVMGRICFYLNKFKKDIDCFSNITKYNSAKTILTKKSEMIFNDFIDTFTFYKRKWNRHINKVNLSKQPYNFNYKIFKMYNKNITL